VQIALIFENGTGREEAELLVRKIKTVFSQPFISGEQILETTAGFGIRSYPCDGEETGSLLKNADHAMDCTERDYLKV
jgi:GGDEF domain-containing protein